MTMATRPGSESDAGCLREMRDDVYHLHELDTPPSVIVDIGANIGAFSILAATMFPDATIRAFEPEPENYALLVANVDAYGFGDRITTVHAAVADHRDGVDLHPGHGLTHTCTVPPGGRCEANPGHDTHTVRSDSVTLEDAFDGFDQIDLLKVDCEGSEFEIFGGASPATIAKAVRLRMEIHDYRGPVDLEALRTKLASAFTLREHAFISGSGGYWFGDRP